MTPRPSGSPWLAARRATQRQSHPASRWPSQTKQGTSAADARGCSAPARGLRATRRASALDVPTSSDGPRRSHQPSPRNQRRVRSRPETRSRRQPPKAEPTLKHRRASAHIRGENPSLRHLAHVRPPAKATFSKTKRPTRLKRTANPEAPPDLANPPWNRTGAANGHRHKQARPLTNQGHRLAPPDRATGPGP